MSSLPKYLYRITHIENIEHISHHGITQIDSPKPNPSYKTIGDVTLINTRKNKKVVVDDTKQVIRLGDYIPFYFGPRMPMLFVIQKGSNFVPEKVVPSDIVYCVLDFSKLYFSPLELYFSNGHATDNFTQFFSKTSITKINELVDFNAVNAKYWRADTDLDLKRRKQAEILVKGDIDTEMIVGYAVYDQTSKTRLTDLGVPEKQIAIRPNYYF